MLTFSVGLICFVVGIGVMNRWQRIETEILYNRYLAEYDERASLQDRLSIVSRERDATEDELIKVYTQLPKRDAKGRFV